MVGDSKTMTLLSSDQVKANESVRTTTPGHTGMVERSAETRGTTTDDRPVRTATGKTQRRRLGRRLRAGSRPGCAPRTANVPALPRTVRPVCVARSHSRRKQVRCAHRRARELQTPPRTRQGDKHVRTNGCRLRRRPYRKLAGRADSRTTRARSSCEKTRDKQPVGGPSSTSSPTA